MSAGRMQTASPCNNEYQMLIITTTTSWLLTYAHGQLRQECKQPGDERRWWREWQVQIQEVNREVVSVVFTTQVVQICLVYEVHAVTVTSHYCTHHILVVPQSSQQYKWQCCSYCEFGHWWPSWPRVPQVHQYRQTIQYGIYLEVYCCSICQSCHHHAVIIHLMYTQHDE